MLTLNADAPAPEPRAPLWKIFLLGYLVIVAVIFALYPWLGYLAQSVLYIGVALTAAALILISVYLHRPQRRIAWYLFLVALLSAALADASYASGALGNAGEPPFPSISDVFYFVFYGAVALGVVMLLRSNSRVRDIASYGDSIIITASATLLSWTFLIHPMIDGQDIPLLDLVVSVGYPISDLFVLSLLVMLLFVGRTIVPATSFLMAGFLLYLIADSVYIYQLVNEMYGDSSVIVFEYAWMGGYALIGIAALHPSMHSVGSQSSTDSRSLTWQRMGILMILPVISLAIISMRALTSESTDSTIPIIGAFVLLLMAMPRVALLANEVGAAVEDTRASDERYLLASRATNDAIWDLDPHTESVTFSDAIATHFGHNGQQQQTLAWWQSLIHPGDAVRVDNALRLSLEGMADTIAEEYRLRRGDGSWAHVIDRGFIVRDDHGRATRAVGSITDFSEMRRIEAQLEYQAFHDSLTGLLNRDVFRSRLEQAVERRKRTAEQVAVLFIDIDRFKNVNDSLGHVAGDTLLIEIANRLGHCLRQVDTLSRRGGDEFTVLLADATEEQVRATAERIGELVRQPIRLDEHEISVTASIGVALGERGRDAPEDMIRDADVAMYSAKKNGGNSVEVFDGTFDPFTIEAMTLEADLRRAVERQEFELVFQPMVDLASGRISYLEALVRWRRPGHGVVLPGEFLPVAEETGLIVPIGRQVLEITVRQIATWIDDEPGVDIPPVFINCSPREFRRADLAQEVAAALGRYGLDGFRLGIEVSEQVVLEDAIAARHTIDELRNMGVQLAIDDFGTGNSSLSHLRHLHVDVLKIDKSFTDELFSRSSDHALISAVIAVGLALNIHVLVEGIETMEQATLLGTLGSELGQGYYFARPMSAALALDLLRSVSVPSHSLALAAD